MIEVVAPEALRRARLELRGREALPQLRERLWREVPTCVADLRITNDGALSDAVAQIDRWWRHLTTPVSSM